MDEYQKDTQELIAKLEAYQAKYATGLDSGHHIERLIFELKADLEISLEENQ